MERADLRDIALRLVLIVGVFVLLTTLAAVGLVATGWELGPGD